MTEKEFDQKVEDIAARFEQKVENAADRMDKGLTKKYNKSRSFRFTVNGISMAAQIGLLAAAKPLAGKGYPTAALWCAVLGAVGLGTHLLLRIILRREK